MIYSLFNLYVAPEIIKNRNMIIDNLEDFLSTKKFWPVNLTGNFIKPALNIDFIVEVNTDSISSTTGATSTYDILAYKNGVTPNYCMISRRFEVNSGVVTNYKKLYYFIDKIEWKSDKCFKLYLTMDVLNTFALGTDFTLSSMTTLKRAHKDRYYSISDTKMRVKIDKTPEGFNPILYNNAGNFLYKVEQELMTNNLPESLTPIMPRKWYLVYKTLNQPSALQAVNPVKCYVTASEGFRAKISQAFMTSSYMQSNNLTFLRVTSINHMNNDVYMTDATNSKMFKISGNPANKEQPLYYVEITQSTTSTTAVKYSYKVANYRRTGTNTGVWEGAEISSGEGNIWFYRGYGDLGNYPIRFDNRPDADIDDNHFAFQIVPTAQNVTITGIKGIDRTDSRLVKIIELPYAPFKLGVEDYVIIPDINVSYDGTGALLIYDEEAFSTPITSGVLTQYLFNDSNKPTSADLTASYSTSRESKLLHSEFFNLKYFYDSFSLVIPLERIDTLSAYNGTFNFVVANTMQSKMMFSLDNILWSGKTEDFPNIIPVSRNNEIALYTSQYLDYLRTGYNYDLKSKQRQEISAGVGMGLTTIGAIVSGVLGVASGNPAVAVGAIAGGITGVASSVVSNVNNIISQEQNLQAKLATLKAQSASVSNIDDVSLLDYYTEGNKLLYAPYVVSSQVSNAIGYLFHCTGYKMDIHTNNLQSYTNSRKWFNFIQADLDISSTNPTITPDIINEIKTRYSDGVLYFHRNIVNNQYIYNFDMTYENWEVSMYVNN